MITNILTAIGGIVLVLAFIQSLFWLISKLTNLKSVILGFVSQRIKHKKLEKLAIKSKIEDAINDTVSDLIDELPKGWINKVSIVWVREKSASTIEDNEIILRIKPLESQDFNLVNGVYFFFTQSLFPTTKEVIPNNIQKAAALQFSKRTISNKHPYLIPKFEQEILDEEVLIDSTILNYYSNYDQLDYQGYFSGVLLREVSDVAKKSRYTQIRNQMEEEIESILDHLIDFQNQYGTFHDDWCRFGPVNSYALMLVAKPSHKSVSPYVTRAKERINQGIDRLYVLGCNQERRFVRKVIDSIMKIPEYKLVEMYSLHRDYRGEDNGIGALLINTNKQ